MMDANAWAGKFRAAPPSPLDWRDKWETVTGMNRRQVLAASAAAILPAGESAAAGTTAPGLGIVSYSYWKRWRGNYSSVRFPPFKDVLELLDHAKGLRAGGIQAPVQGWTADLAEKVRASCEGYGMFLEGIIEPPKDKADAPRFERELRLGKAAGATVFRAALGGRRYELFRSYPEFQAWRQQALRALALAEPVARRLGVRIGIENHKDLECDELLLALRELGSSHIGACIDTGNNVALLEEPLEVVEALAPFVVTVHLKDMAMAEFAEGFRLSEVPLGQGCLPLDKMIATMRAANPQVRFFLEMITRDPLEIPCLKQEYWATFPHKPGAHLARTLSMVRSRKEMKLTQVGGLALDAHLALEEENVVKCMEHAALHLGLGGALSETPAAKGASS
jgi:sugar phosphate isomerase/epimerase